MADIRITRRHGLEDEAAARGEVEKLAEELVSRFGGRWAWRGDVAECDIRGGRGRVVCRGDEVTMEVTLPLMMKALRGPLEREIRRRFDQHFLPAS